MSENEESMESRLEQILNDALIKATDTYSVPPQIIWVDNSTIATLGNFSASTGKAKAKKTFNVSALVAASLSNGTVLNYRACLPEGKRRILYVDTEQSRYHCHNVLARILSWQVCLRIWTTRTWTLSGFVNTLQPSAWKS